MVMSCQNLVKKERVVIGTYTDGASDGIYCVDLDLENSRFENLTLLIEEVSPSYLTVSKDGSKVYAVSEVGNYNGEKSGALISYEWDLQKDKLEKVAELSSGGEHPCYIALSKNERYLAAANYTGGSLVVTDLELENRIIKQHVGGFEGSDRQASPHVHCTFWSPDNRYIFAVDLGIDKIMAYPFNDGVIGEGSVAFELPEGEGARHLVFNKNGDVAYLAAELSSKVYSLNYNKELATFDKIGELSTLPSNFTGDNSVADIHISPDQSSLYVSNRGLNSVAHFRIKEDGDVELLSNYDVMGDWPRNFVITPDGNYMLIANQKSDNITLFSIDSEGKLNFLNESLTVGSPVCLKVVGY